MLCVTHETTQTCTDKHFARTESIQSCRTARFFFKRLISGDTRFHENRLLAEMRLLACCWRPFSLAAVVDFRPLCADWLQPLLGRVLTCLSLSVDFAHPRYCSQLLIGYMLYPLAVLGIIPLNNQNPLEW